MSVKLERGHVSQYDEPSSKALKKQKVESSSEEFEEEDSGDGSVDEESEEDDDGEEDGESDDGESEEEEDTQNNIGNEQETQGLSIDEVSKREQQILTKSRTLNSALKNQRAKATREGGLRDATEHLKLVNENFVASRQINSENKTIEVYDSRNLLGSSDLMDIAVRNIKLGSSGKVLRKDDFLRRLKFYLLADTLRGNTEDDSSDDFINQRHSFNQYNWFSLGTFIYSRGSKAITTDHLLGPLEIEKKTRVFKQREKINDVGKVITAESVTSDDINEKSINQTPNAVQDCYKVFAQKAKGRTINIFKFFINPRSFSQSIENMFYTSFLIRDGRLQLGEDEEGYPTISDLPPLPEDPKEREKERASRIDRPSNHIIFQLEYESWKNLVDKFNITESFIPDRDS